MDSKLTMESQTNNAIDNDNDTRPAPEAPLAVKDEFETWPDLSAVIEDWAVKSTFNYRTPVNDATRVDFRCKYEVTSGCSWQVFASVAKKTMMVTVRIMQAKHSCDGLYTDGLEVVKRISYLTRVVPA